MYPYNMRYLMAVAVVALAGCTSMEEVRVPTPFGSIELGKKAGSESVRQANERRATARVGIDDATARMAELEVCVSRVRYNDIVDSCLCYIAHGFPMPRACGAPVATENSPVPTAPTVLQVPPTVVASGPSWPEPPSSGLREQIKAAESYVSSPRDGHVCWGHYILPGESFPEFMSVEDCEALLSSDIDQARTEALRVFGQADDGRTELCYWTGCARLRSQSDDLASAVLTDAILNRVDAGRASRIAGAIQ